MKKKNLTIDDRIQILESEQGVISSDEKNVLREVLHNTEKAMKVYESTDYGAVTGIKNFALDLVSVVVPNLVANSIVSVQPIEAQVGVINYMKYLYGDNKGRVTAKDVFASAIGENNTDMYYSSDEVVGEAIEFAGGAFKGNLAWTPVVPGTFNIRGFDTSNNEFVIVDKTKTVVNQVGNPTLESNVYGHGEELEGFLVVDPVTMKEVGTATGTLDYQSGAFEINITGITPATGDDVDYEASYSYDQRSIGDGKLGSGGVKVPSVEIKISTVMIQARSRKLKALFAFDSMITLQNEYDTDIQELLQTQVAYEVMHEIDGEIMNDLFRGAGLRSDANWDAKAPVGVSVRDHYESFQFHVNGDSNRIFQATKRARGNFIIAGINVATIIESSINFKPAEISDGIVGPHIIGHLGGLLVVKNPYYGDNDYLVGFIGANKLEAGYVYAPYLPITSTAMVMADDFVGRQGWATVYGKKMLNPKMYIKGSILK